MDECDSESIVHTEYTSDLTYTCSWLKVSRNRVLLTLFSALLESPRSSDRTATNRGHEKVPESNVRSHAGDLSGQARFSSPRVDHQDFLGRRNHGRRREASFQNWRAHRPNVHHL